MKTSTKFTVGYFFEDSQTVSKEVKIPQICEKFSINATSAPLVPFFNINKSGTSAYS